MSKIMNERTIRWMEGWMGEKTDMSMGVWMVRWTDKCPVLSIYASSANQGRLTQRWTLHKCNHSIKKHLKRQTNRHSVLNGFISLVTDFITGLSYCNNIPVFIFHVMPSLAMAGSKVGSPQNVRRQRSETWAEKPLNTWSRRRDLTTNECCWNTVTIKRGQNYVTASLYILWLLQYFASPQYQNDCIPAGTEISYCSIEGIHCDKSHCLLDSKLRLI